MWAELYVDTFQQTVVKRVTAESVAVTWTPNVKNA
jgi:hypothetical protein